MAIAILYYDATGRTVIREHTYATTYAANRALDRKIAAVKATRTANDAPSCHH